jgi:PPK2 family polyphosphate:nucleotide phosphotransferase
MNYAFKLDQGDKIKLKDYDPRFDAGLKKKDAVEPFAKFDKEIGELQELLYAAASHSVLIVLQGMDTSGKDGTVRSVMASVNPQGCQVVSFKTPTTEELAHDFLWRVHVNAPSKGMLHIFNRSHYEEVLIVRVHNLQPEEVWKKHYDHINNFERLLYDSNTIILKFFLHISPEEQLERLLAREQEKDKRWKLSAGDYVERRYWDQYQEAYEDLLHKCSTPEAPWYIVPADRKWFRNLAIAESIVEALRPYRSKWEEALQARGEKAYAELQEARANGKISDTEVTRNIDKAKAHSLRANGAKTDLVKKD